MLKRRSKKTGSTVKIKPINIKAEEQIELLKYICHVKKKQNDFDATFNNLNFKQKERNFL